MLASRDDLATALQRVIPAEENGFADQQLELASGYVQAYTGQSFVYSATTTVVLRPRGRIVLLPELPVLSVSAVSVDGAEVEDWVLEPDGIIRFVTSPANLVTVSYSHGWQTVPADVVAVVAQMAAGMVNAPSDNVRSQAIDTFSVSYFEASSAISGEHRQILDRYRLRRLA